MSFTSSDHHARHVASMAERLRTVLASGEPKLLATMAFPELSSGDRQIHTEVLTDHADDDEARRRLRTWIVCGLHTNVEDPRLCWMSGMAATPLTRGGYYLDLVLPRSMYGVCISPWLRSPPPLVISAGELRIFGYEVIGEPL